jgi:hypothetical protein
MLNFLKKIKMKKLLKTIFTIFKGEFRKLIQEFVSRLLLLYMQHLLKRLEESKNKFNGFGSGQEFQAVKRFLQLNTNPDLHKSFLDGALTDDELKDLLK